jgi:hypothetical protein
VNFVYPFFFGFNSQLSVISRGIKMSGIKLEDIREITKNPQGKGYLIIFNDNRVIILYKKRTIAALLTLIRYGAGLFHSKKCQKVLESISTESFRSRHIGKTGQTVKINS